MHGHALEQISMVYGNDKVFDSAYYYFNRAIPIIRKFSNSALASAYNNFTNLLAYQGRSAEGLVYIDSAIAIARQKKDTRSETIYLTNRGLLLGELKQFDAGLELLTSCAATNLNNKWLDNLVFDYAGIADIYWQQGNFKSAYEYTEKYHALNDSLSGVQVNLKIAGLAATNESQQKQLEINAAKEGLERRSWIIGLGMLVIAFGAWGWFTNNKKNKKKIIESRAGLDTLTRLLVDKNSLLSSNEEVITALQQQLQNSQAATEIITPVKKESLLIATEPAEFEENIYNQRILTNDDLNAFKTYFEKAYPGYMRRLRMAHPQLSEAEERLFLFIKLNLKGKEAAAILGISADSVKKTRTRLRKRLDFEEVMDLEKYIGEF